MRRYFSFFFIFTFVSLAHTTAMAASPWTLEPSYGSKTAKKLEFGLQNFLGGWTELYNQPVNAKEENLNIAAAAGKGIANAFVYTLGGLAHLVTFPIPVDIPLPNDGVIEYGVPIPETADGTVPQI